MQVVRKEGEQSHPRHQAKGQGGHQRCVTSHLAAQTLSLPIAIGRLALKLERVFDSRGSAIPMSAVTFSPRYSISLRLPREASRAQRGRNPALLRVHLHRRPATTAAIPSTNANPRSSLRQEESRLS